MFGKLPCILALGWRTSNTRDECDPNWVKMMMVVGYRNFVGYVLNSVNDLIDSLCLASVGKR